MQEKNEIYVKDVLEKITKRYSNEVAPVGVFAACPVFSFP
jgi:hypothetical protein